MDSLSCFKNHLATLTIFIHFTCVCPNHGFNHNQDASNLVPISSFCTPKKIIKKVHNTITPYIICFKPKKQDELSPHNSKNILRKIFKAIRNPFFNMKQLEDDKCLWKKTILMGEKCQPLEFSGAIFYDSEGNQLSEPPKTPKIIPLISFGQCLSQTEAK